MPTKETVRVGLINILFNSQAGGSTFGESVDKMLAYQVSQGLVLKINRGWKLDKWIAAEDIISQDDLLKEKVVAVESLI